MASKNATLKDYYYLTKPGIIYGNLLTALAGFMLANRWHVDLELLIATLVGIALVIAAACVFNNYIDRGIDRQMARTRQRALVTGVISGRQALVYASLLGVTGFIVLSLLVNSVTAVLGAIGFIDYVVLYGLSKRRWTEGTLIGSISGAIPPAAGYTAVTGHVDGGAIILFLILTCWQMPHFYAIAIYRHDDYRAAGLPVLPVAKNNSVAKRRIMLYIIAFIAVSLVLRLYNYAGDVYALVTVGLGLFWLRQGYNSYHRLDDKEWGRQMFRFSLIVICGLSVALAFGSLLP